MQFEIRFEPADGGTKCTMNINCYPKGDTELNEANCKEGKDKILGVYKAVEDYLIKNADALLSVPILPCLFFHRLVFSGLHLSLALFFFYMESQNSEQVLSLVASANTKGKHRILAELKRLEQEARILEEELDQIKKMEKASPACKELLVDVESRPDPLLPM
ncbi:hypothetical protein AgCh_018510 [Apium graveolens]